MSLNANEINVEHEPEAQFDAQSTKGLIRIEAWIVSVGGAHTKSQHDAAIYYDTKNFRLAREGIEGRGKDKGGVWRFDLKTPVDTHQRLAMPDEDGVVERLEIKKLQPKERPSLRAFFGQSDLQPVARRVKNFFDKNLEPKFIADFKKRKFDRPFIHNGKKAVIEYSLQTGHVRSIDGKNKTDTLYIAEVEHKSGDKAAYRAAVREFKSHFADSGVSVMMERKWHFGLKIARMGALPKAVRKIDKVFSRMHAQKAPACKAAA